MKRFSSRPVLGAITLAAADGSARPAPAQAYTLQTLAPFTGPRAGMLTLIGLGLGGARAAAA